MKWIKWTASIIIVWSRTPRVHKYYIYQILPPQSTWLEIARIPFEYFIMSQCIRCTIHNVWNIPLIRIFYIQSLISIRIWYLRELGWKVRTLSARVVAPVGLGQSAPWRPQTNLQDSGELWITLAPAEPSFLIQRPSIHFHNQCLLRNFNHRSKIKSAFKRFSPGLPIC